MDVVKAIRPFDASSGSSDIFTLMCIDAENEGEEHHIFYGVEWWKQFVRRPQGHAFVADSAGIVAGFLAVELRGADGAYIAWLTVAKAWRRRGVGRALLNYAIDWLCTLGATGKLSLHVETSNAIAIALYRSVGLVFVSDADGDLKIIRDYIAEGRDSFLMELKIPVD